MLETGINAGVDTGIQTGAVPADLAAIDAQLAGMEPISLDELNAQARLMTRVDRKYFRAAGAVPAAAHRHRG